MWGRKGGCHSHLAKRPNSYCGPKAPTHLTPATVLFSGPPGVAGSSAACGQAVVSVLSSLAPGPAQACGPAGALETNVSEPTLHRGPSAHVSPSQLASVL